MELGAAELVVVACGVDCGECGDVKACWCCELRWGVCGSEYCCECVWTM